METVADVIIRRGTPDDADAIAAAHRDSIRLIGPAYYEAEIVSAWGAGLDGRRYREAMRRGEIFFVAVGSVDDRPEILGFSTDYVDGDEHRTAVYVTGRAARQGVGSALFRAAEASAVAAGGRSIRIDASLAAVEFYKTHGFEETGRGEHRLRSGISMPCVFMRKTLT